MNASKINQVQAVTTPEEKNRSHPHNGQASEPCPKLINHICVYTPLYYSKKSSTCNTWQMQLPWTAGTDKVYGLKKVY